MTKLVVSHLGRERHQTTGEPVVMLKDWDKYTDNRVKHITFKKERESK